MLTMCGDGCWGLNSVCYLASVELLKIIVENYSKRCSDTSKDIGYRALIESFDALSLQSLPKAITD